MTKVEMINMMKDVLDQCVTGDVLKDADVMMYELDTFCEDALDDGVSMKDVMYIRAALEAYTDTLL